MTDVHRILLVIDDELLAELTEFRLSLLGYDLHTVREGNQALQLIDKLTPHLVIVSADIRDMECTELINFIRTRTTNHEVPVITFSVDSGMDAVRCAFAAGSNDYVITPYDPAVLEEKIESLLIDDRPARRPMLI